MFPLKNNIQDNGRRDTKLDKEELKQMIVSAGDFLTRNVHSDGKFTYGYFSCFDTEIKFYNMLRHASTLYSMCEVYELFPDEQLLQAIKRGIISASHLKSLTYSNPEYVSEKYLCVCLMRDRTC